jgi:hypothetical protein
LYDTWEQIAYKRLHFYECFIGYILGNFADCSSGDHYIFYEIIIEMENVNVILTKLQKSLNDGMPELYSIVKSNIINNENSIIKKVLEKLLSNADKIENESIKTAFNKMTTKLLENTGKNTINPQIKEVPEKKENELKVYGFLFAGFFTYMRAIYEKVALKVIDNKQSPIPILNMVQDIFNYYLMVKSFRENSLSTKWKSLTDYDYKARFESCNKQRLLVHAEFSSIISWLEGNDMQNKIQKTNNKLTQDIMTEIINEIKSRSSSLRVPPQA